MWDIPEGYQIEEKERLYLERLEEYRRQKRSLTPLDFCRLVDLAGTSSIKRYKVLKAALNEYGWYSARSRMRGEPPDLLKTIDLGPDPRIEKLEAKVSRLEGELEARASTSPDLKAREEELNGLRGLLMAFIAHYVKSEVRSARDIENRLAALARELLPNTQIPHLGPGDSKDHDVITKLLDDVSRGHRDGRS